MIVRIQKLPFWLSLACLLMIGHSAGATPSVVTSIKPVHAMVSAIMAGVGTPILLLSGQDSHHHFHLRPSAARKLHQADLVFWVGPGLETGLMTPLAQWLPEERVIALTDTPNITRLHKRAIGVRLDGARSRLNNKSARIDPHLWFDPHNMQAFIHHVEQALINIDPANQARYRLNGEHLRVKLEALEQELSTLLAPHSETPYIVIHDAFHYLEQRYNLHAAGILVADSEMPPGARGLAEMRRLIKNRQIHCVFYDGQHEERLARTLTSGGSARMVTLDIQGRNIPAGTDFYFQLMRGLATDLRRCLQ